MLPLRRRPAQSPRSQSYIGGVGLYDCRVAGLLEKGTGAQPDAAGDEITKVQIASVVLGGFSLLLDWGATARAAGGV
jgi:hypothetical protein